ncbi:DUF6944 family repetitive protein [Sporolactobacillus terrae]|uniref:Uncharacterized protein n=1 Tax=Sporolactobacillus terrae TaxID=269673 RepID=A0A410D8J9_9BACL|nr:hypothetical protein [Sporolactobacillus terrae]QAA22447.1 hypothetical protein C0674_07315 [Sporolactobacillus terrae]QAA25421.1 hypothetical protein C0679_07295 [Sporolactobacillus terrae]UAK17231.1 hypothetical protein K7399_04640 [Sporolactobacillus terrae]BBN98765.1 hypothetical protein St703_14700 [Sporolactobacillus terrae]
MNRKELSEGFALLSITIGKVMAAIGQTPIKTLDRETQDQLILLGSIIQVGAGASLIDLTSNNSSEQLGLALTVIGYGSFVLQFIRDEDDDRILLKRAISSNLKEVLASFVIATDPIFWRKMYQIIGTMLVCIGNYIQVMGRNRLLAEGEDYTLFDPLVTFGTWMEAGGSAILTLGTIEETI